MSAGGSLNKVRLLTTEYNQGTFPVRFQPKRVAGINRNGCPDSPDYAPIPQRRLRAVILHVVGPERGSSRGEPCRVCVPGGVG